MWYLTHMATLSLYQIAKNESNRLSKEIGVLEDRIEAYRRAVAERKEDLRAIVDLLERIPLERHNVDYVPVGNSVDVVIRRGPRGLIKRLVLDVLESHPIGLKANSILAKINSKSSKPYLRTSLSPQLSRLKEDGYIMLEGKIWRLKKIEPLDATPGKESPKGSDTTLAKDREAGSGGGP